MFQWAIPIISSIHWVERKFPGLVEIDAIFFRGTFFLFLSTFFLQKSTSMPRAGASRGKKCFQNLSLPSPVWCIVIKWNSPIHIYQQKHQISQYSVAYIQLGFIYHYDFWVLRLILSNSYQLLFCFIKSSNFPN